jgi:hypothetical protein
MHASYFEIPINPTDPERLENTARLWNALRAGERLAIRRRMLTVCSVVLLGLALGFAHAQGRAPFTISVALLILCFATTVRVAWLERRNRVLTSDLLVTVRARPF